MSEDAVSRPSVDQDRRRQVAASLSVGNPANNARHLVPGGDDQFECPVVIDVHEIRPYEANPRRSTNDRFEEIKASILAAGLRNPLTVTRRPNAAHFIIEAGGNTRLRALQELAEETGEARFRRVSVIVRPWRCESHVLTAHLIENELRGEMTFWDKACGVVALKGELEAESGSVLSLRQFAQVLKAQGLSRDHVTLAHYVYATERLCVLGEGIPHFSGLDVKTMQPRLNALRRYAERAAEIPEEDLYATVLDPVFHAIVTGVREGQSFSASATCDACEAAVASRLGLTVTDLLDALVALTRAGTQDHQSASKPASNAIFGVEAPARPPDSAQPSAVGSANSNNPLEDRVGLRRTPRPCEGEVAEGEQDIGALAQRLAQLAGLGAHLRTDPGAPFGFRFDQPLDRDPPCSAHGTEIGWVLRFLAMLPDEQARAARLSCVPDPHEGSQSAIGFEAPVNAASLFLRLLAPSHVVDEALWALLQRVREVSATASIQPRRARSSSAAQERD